MANLVRARSWGQVKPPSGAQIDRTHPLAQGLKVCVPFTEGGGYYPRDIARGIDCTTTTGPIPYWRSSPLGVGIRTQSSAAASGVALPNGNWIPTASVTVAVAKFKVDTTLRSVATFGDGGGKMDGFVPFGGTVYWRYGGADLTVAAPANIGSDIWTFTAGYRGRTIYQNGRLLASSGTAATSSTAAGKYYIGSDGSNGGDDAVIAFFYVWERELTQDEILWLNAEPYAFIAPPVPRVFYLGLYAPSAGTTVTPGVATATATAYAPTSSTTPQPGVASATATGFAPTVKATPQPGVASATATAYNVTVSTSSAVTATPGVASATATAFAPTAKVTPQPGLASTSASAFAPTSSTTVTAGRALATATAYAPTITPTFVVGLAAATATAYAPTARLTVQVVVALATATAYPPALGEPRDIDYQLGPLTTGWYAGTTATGWRAGPTTREEFDVTDISSLSTVYVKVPVVATEDGGPVDPTVGSTVTMAFTDLDVDPVGGDWKTASWETDATRDPDRYLARCLVGPTGGTITLVDGTYDVWVKITGISPEVPVVKAGAALVVT